MNSTSWRKVGLALAILFVTSAPGPTIAVSPADPPGKFNLTSPDFSPGGKIPAKFTCDGADNSPALNWTDPPAGTKSLALIVDDPDAPVGTWVHWVIFNLPPETRGISEAAPKEAELADGSRQGQNDFRRIGYGGPCPPSGPAHHYFFKLYALDMKLAAGPGLTKQELEKAMQGHLLAHAELMGRYKRGSR
jgi:Raf kinase inhibitor-like YbhB/YbcL family protein